MKTTPHLGSRRLTPAGVIFVLLMLGWAFALAAIASAESVPANPSLSWERSIANAPGDTILVPVRWEPACDINGCADSYRITWTVRQASGSTTTTQTARVVRDTTIARTQDTASVVAPPILQPATVCVYVVAVRRAKPSEASSSCRTIESPDVAPPPVKGIKWDSIGVDTATALLDSLMPNTLRVTPSTLTVDSLGNPTLPLAHDSTGALIASSLISQLCVTGAHASEPSTMLLVPTNQPYTAHQFAQHVARCVPAVQRAYPDGRVRAIGSPYLRYRIEASPS
jgi:hypothetical protein